MIVAIAKPDHSSGGNVHHLAQKRVEGGGGVGRLHSLGSRAGFAELERW